MNITMVGTGDMWAHSHSACFLINDKILIDIPNGTCKTLRRMGKKVRHIEYLIITHLHGDHFFDIPFFLAAKLRAGSPKLTIIGNKEVRRKFEALIKLGFPDWMDKVVAHLDIVWIDNKQLKDFDLADDIKLESVAVDHGGFYPTHGYIFSNESINLGFTGDSTLGKGVEYICGHCNYVITDVSEPISTDAHMGIDAFKYIINEYPQVTFIPNHMDDEVVELLQHSYIPQMILPRDGDSIKLE